MTSGLLRQRKYWLQDLYYCRRLYSSTLQLSYPLAESLLEILRTIAIGTHNLRNEITADQNTIARDLPSLINHETVDWAEIVPK